MPIYDYQCKKCKHKTEQLRSMADKDVPVKCEECSGKAVRVISPVSLSTSEGFRGVR